jgi:hypothetical protein
LWGSIVKKELNWQELKKKLHLSMELLPIAFDICYADTIIQVIDGEHTISVSTNNLEQLKKLKKAIEKESGKMITPYGCAGSPKAIFKKSHRISKSV